jgi:hypothetical protein
MAFYALAARELLGRLHTVEIVAVHDAVRALPARPVGGVSAPSRGGLMSPSSVCGARKLQKTVRLTNFGDLMTVMQYGATIAGNS